MLPTYGGITDVQRGETQGSHGIYRKPDSASQAALGRCRNGLLRAHRWVQDHLPGGYGLVVPYSPSVAAGALGEPTCRLDLASRRSRDLRFQERGDDNACD